MDNSKCKICSYQGDAKIVLQLMRNGEYACRANCMECGSFLKFVKKTPKLMYLLAQQEPFLRIK